MISLTVKIQTKEEVFPWKVHQRKVPFVVLRRMEPRWPTSNSMT